MMKNLRNNKSKPNDVGVSTMEGNKQDGKK
jgi:hypothetical protein